MTRNSHLRALAAHVLIFTAVCFIGWAIPVEAQTTARLENPTRFEGIADLIEGFLRAVIMIALPVISFFIVLAGFYFVAARGNPGKLADAKRNFLYVVMGAALILGAWVLATLIGGTVTQLLR